MLYGIDYTVNIVNTIANIVNPYASPDSPRALSPVQESGPARDQLPRQQEPHTPIVVAEDVRSQLQVRAVILSRESNPSGLSPRGREAVVAYRALHSEEERQHISDLLGVDEYA